MKGNGLGGWEGGMGVGKGVWLWMGVLVFTLILEGGFYAKIVGNHMCTFLHMDRLP